MTVYTLVDGSSTTGPLTFGFGAGGQDVADRIEITLAEPARQHTCICSCTCGNVEPCLAASLTLPEGSGATAIAAAN